MTTKKEREEFIKNCLDIFYDTETHPINFRILSLLYGLEMGREYLSVYKTPYKYTFMGDPIRFTETILDIMETMARDTMKKYNLIYEIIET